ncbi:hypothetical protein QE381_002728 [Microbacterium sp. SORGH_AS 888]|nr:hypothetical protein [Microbacterium sp. SORGH_AS_0888]
MTARPGIIMPAVLFASQADRERALSVIGAIIPVERRHVKPRAVAAAFVTDCYGPDQNRSASQRAWRCQWNAPPPSWPL